MEKQSQQDQQIEPNLQNYPSTPVQPVSNSPKNKIVKWMKLILFPLVIIIILMGGFFAYKTFFAKPVIKTYKDCVKTKGSVIQESYPQVCVTKSGLRFAQEVSSVTPSLTKAEECYKQVTNTKCPEGAECMQATPAAAFCSCMGGTLEIKEEGTEKQYEICVINEEQYDGITFQDLEQGWYWGDSNQKKADTPEDWIFSGNGSRSDCWHRPDTSCNTFLPPDEQTTETSDYLLEKSEGSCVDDTGCQWAGEGCGGGHGVCTNDPEKYKDIVTTCDAVESFPSNRGFTCGCIEVLGKCGWKK